jgi:hypothetical protein
MIQMKKFIPPAPTGSRWQVPMLAADRLNSRGDQMVRPVIKLLKQRVKFNIFYMKVFHSF